MDWLKYKFLARNVKRHTEKAYFINISPESELEYHNYTDTGKGVWIPKKLATYDPKTQTYNAVVGSDFKLKIYNYDSFSFAGRESLDTQETGLELNANEFIDKMDNLHKEQLAIREEFKKAELEKKREKRAEREANKLKQEYQAKKNNLTQAQQANAVAKIEKANEKVQKIKKDNKSLREAQIVKLKPIQASKAIERQAKRDLKLLSDKVNKSVKYWSIAQFNKFNRKEVSNISNALKVEFNALKKQWGKVTSEYSKIYAKKLNRSVKNYVDSNYLSQNADFKLKSVSKKGNDVLKATYLENIALIKSIPQEIIKRYESALYNAVSSFDGGSLDRIAKSIGNISNNRAKLIARDQTSKAIEAFSMARASQLGFEYYQWQTSEDERVSTGKGGHKQLNQRLYRYDTPTAIIDSYGNKGHCSQRVNCRCVAVAVMLKPNQDVVLVKDSESGDYYRVVEK